MGDFNEVVSQDEQLRGNPRKYSKMTAFRECLLDCGLTDLGYKGYPYTWNNRRSGEDNVQVRLDRGTATTPFLALFPNTQIEHIMTEESDHLALLAHISAEDDSSIRGDHRGFVYEEMWTKHENYDNMVNSALQVCGDSCRTCPEPCNAGFSRNLGR
jgi:hypothetical protein